MFESLPRHPTGLFYCFDPPFIKFHRSANGDGCSSAGASADEDPRESVMIQINNIIPMITAVLAAKIS